MTELLQALEGLAETEELTRKRISRPEPVDFLGESEQVPAPE